MSPEEQKELRELLEKSHVQQEKILAEFSQINDLLSQFEQRQDEASHRMAAHMGRLMTLEAYAILKEIGYGGKTFKRIDLISERQSGLRNAIGKLAIDSHKQMLEVMDSNEDHAKLARDILSLLEEELKTTGVN